MSKNAKFFAGLVVFYVTCVIIGVLISLFGVPFFTNSVMPLIRTSVIPQSGDITVGNTVVFGRYSWRVLDVQDDRALLLSELILQDRPYHNLPVATTWERSQIRQYLNSDFYDRFTQDEKASIIEILVVNNDNPWYGTAGGNDTRDKIFLLSLEEVVRYFGDSGQLNNRPENAQLINDQFNNERIAVNTSGQIIALWWLRSPGRDAQNAAFVWNRTANGNAQGHISVNGGRVVDDVNLDSNFIRPAGIRPALWLCLDMVRERPFDIPPDTSETQSIVSKIKIFFSNRIVIIVSLTILSIGFCYILYIIIRSRLNYKFFKMLDLLSEADDKFDVHFNYYVNRIKEELDTIRERCCSAKKAIKKHKSGGMEHIFELYKFIKSTSKSITSRQKSLGEMQKALGDDFKNNTTFKETYNECAQYASEVHSRLEEIRNKLNDWNVYLRKADFDKSGQITQLIANLGDIVEATRAISSLDDPLENKYK